MSITDEQIAEWSRLEIRQGPYANEDGILGWERAKEIVPALLAEVSRLQGYPAALAAEVSKSDWIRGACRSIGWSLEHSATGMMRASLNALESGDEAGAAREQVIANREYEWAACIYEVLGMRDDCARARSLCAAVQAGEWTEPRQEAAALPSQGPHTKE